MSEFGHVDFESLKPGNALKFCGIAIEVDQRRKISLPQEEFYDEIASLNARDFAVNNLMVLESAMMIRRLKSLVGCFIWVTITRFGVAFGGIQLASSLLGSDADPKKLLEFISNAGRLIARLKSKHRSLTFFPFVHDSGQGSKAQIIAFPAASFGALRCRGSIEGYRSPLSIPPKSDGAAICKGDLLTFYGGEISRVSRSTSHTEGIALRNASDSTLYLQCLPGEVISGHFSTSPIRHAEDMVPALPPFRDANLGRDSYRNHGDPADGGLARKNFFFLNRRTSQWWR